MTCAATARISIKISLPCLQKFPAYKKARFILYLLPGKNQ
jgi:hypothetical protein